MSAPLTTSQRAALDWLGKRGGDAAFDRNGIALAQGETAPVMRATWNALEVLGHVEIYGGVRQGGKGYGRVRLTSTGQASAKPKPDPYRFPLSDRRSFTSPAMVDDDPAEFRS